MEAIGLMFGVLLGISLVVFLMHFLSKRVATALAGGEGRALDIGGQIIFHLCKWIVIIFVLTWLFHCIHFWPPHWVERIQQRKIVFERVKDAGGWANIKNACASIAAANATNGFEWFRWSKDELPFPKSLAALQPRLVELQPNDDGMLSVQIQIFGGHATGGRGQDFYYLVIVCPWPINVTRPFPINPETKVRYGDRKITDGIL